MGSFTKRALLGAVVLLVLAPGAMAAAFDQRATPDELMPGDNAYVGTHLPALDWTIGRVVQGLAIADATVEVDDPPLTAPPGDPSSSCGGSDPNTFSNTVWFVIHTADRTPFAERTWITLDSADSTYANALVVYEGSVANPTARWCERQNLAGGNALVQFAATAGATYYVEVAAVGPTAPTSALFLQMRARDVQAPQVSFSVDGAGFLAEPGALSRFSYLAADGSSGLAGHSVTVTFKRDGQDAQLLPIGACGPVAPLPGTACTTASSASDRDEIAVTWPQSADKRFAGTGVVRVETTDRAGNLAPAQYALRVADRTPPRAGQPRVRVSAATRSARVSEFCSEPGSVLMRLYGPRNRSRVKKVPLPKRGRAYWRFRRLASGGYVLKTTCIDRSGNSSSSVAVFLLLR